MANLRAAPPRPRAARVAPSYPRAAATLAAAALLLAGCGGIVDNEGRARDGRPQPQTSTEAGPDGDHPSEPDFPGPAGAAPYPYEDTGSDAGPDGAPAPGEPTPPTDPAPSDPAPSDGGPADPAPEDAGAAPAEGSKGAK